MLLSLRAKPYQSAIVVRVPQSIASFFVQEEPALKANSGRSSICLYDDAFGDDVGKAVNKKRTDCEDGRKDVGRKYLRRREELHANGETVWALHSKTFA